MKLWTEDRVDCVALAHCRLNFLDLVFFVQRGLGNQNDRAWSS